MTIIRQLHKAKEDSREQPERVSSCRQRPDRLRALNSRSQNSVQCAGQHRAARDCSEDGRKARFLDFRNSGDPKSQGGSLSKSKRAWIEKATLRASQVLGR